MDLFQYPLKHLKCHVLVTEINQHLVQSEPQELMSFFPAVVDSTDNIALSFS